MSPQPPIDNTRARRIVCDVDVGIDDAWALLMLCKAETAAHPLAHRLEAITCVAGNTGVEQVALNVVQVLQQVQRTDVSYNYRQQASERIVEDLMN